MATSARALRGQAVRPNRTKQLVCGFGGLGAALLLGIAVTTAQSSTQPPSLDAGIPPTQQAAALAEVRAAGVPDLSACGRALRTVRADLAHRRAQRADAGHLGPDATNASYACGEAAEGLAQMDAPMSALAQSAVVQLRSAMEEANTAAQYYAVAADCIAAGQYETATDDLTTGDQAAQRSADAEGAAAQDLGSDLVLPSTGS